MQQPVRIWDRFVRVFHWSVALAFLLNFAVLEEGDPPHEWAGYFILAMVGLRIIWGFVGPRSARFSDFLPTPRRVKAHVAEMLSFSEQPHDGHNPVGGLMILSLLGLLVLTGFSGWLMTTDMFWGEDWVEEVHEACANLTMLLVVVHVTVVVLYSRFGPRNLIKQMWTGRREVRR